MFVFILARSRCLSSVFCILLVLTNRRSPRYPWQSLFEKQSTHRRRLCSAYTEEINVFLSAEFVINSILLGIGLAMDAFSVSLANGLHEPRMSRPRQVFVAGSYAFFQALMPLTGWFFVHTIVETFRVFEPFIPWIALALLAFIGVKMIREALEERKEAASGGPEAAVHTATLTLGALLIQDVATSIDALSVGFTIAEYGFLQALVCALIIAAVTWVICLAGLFIGRKAGTRLSWRAGILGGVILIAIGIEILVKSFL